ncbi:MAG: hypothetical protein KAX65_10160 [Caldilineaceae bacterium]|nr:hypothetical protein [Caldilineaceae bacterium]
MALVGAFKVYFYGITLRIAGSTNLGMTINPTDGGHFEFESCYLWLGTTNASPRISINAGSAGTNCYTSFKNTTFRFGNVGQALLAAGKSEVSGGVLSSAGSVPTNLFLASNNTQEVSFTGVDLSHATGTLVAAQTGSAARFSFAQCRLGSAVTPMATQTPANKSSAYVYVLDCSDGDTHGLFGYYDAFGSIVSSTGTYLTAGAAGQSWQITTTANCSFGTPFVTPWISLYNTTLSSATYELELLRNNGTATAYNDAEVWGEFSAKDISGSTQADFFRDRQSLSAWAAGTAGTAQTAGVGTGSWTIGSSNSPASFIVDSGSVTPAENGHIRARVAVGLASVSSLFLDPQIRT